MVIVQFATFIYQRVSSKKTQRLSSTMYRAHPNRATYIQCFYCIGCFLRTSLQDDSSLKNSSWRDGINYQLVQELFTNEQPKYNPVFQDIIGCLLCHLI